MIVLGLTALIAGLFAPNAAPNKSKANENPLTLPEFPAKPESVTDPVDVRRAISGFDRHLAVFSQRVSGCDHVVRVQIGKNSPTYGRGLAAYGAYCTLGNGQPVALCYEEAIGRFAMVADAFPAEPAWIEAFTLQICASFD